MFSFKILLPTLLVLFVLNYVCKELGVPSLFSSKPAPAPFVCKNLDERQAKIAVQKVEDFADRWGAKVSRKLVVGVEVPQMMAELKELNSFLDELNKSYWEDYNNPVYHRHMEYTFNLTRANQRLWWQMRNWFMENGYIPPLTQKDARAEMYVLGEWNVGCHFPKSPETWDTYEHWRKMMEEVTRARARYVQYL